MTTKYELDDQQVLLILEAMGIVQEHMVAWVRVMPFEHEDTAFMINKINRMEVIKALMGDVYQRIVK